MKLGSALGLFVFLGWTLSFAQPISWGPAVSYPAQRGPLAMVTADFNGDGYSDLAVANSASASVSVMLGNGDGTFQPAVNYALPDGCQPNYLAVGDFKKDGEPDLLVACILSTTLVVLPGNGNGTFASPVITILPAPALTGQLFQLSNLQP